MKIINVEQGSQEWLDLRRKCITATDASILNGTNPFTTPLELWQRKLGLIPEIEENEDMRRGKNQEPIARALLNDRMGIVFNPCCVVSNAHNFLMSSLDGITEDNRFICEIKCPRITGHTATIRGEIKPYYFAQMQHQLYCTGAEKCYFVSYCPDHEKPLHVIEVLPDQEYIDILIEKELDFYHNHLFSFIPTPPKEPFKFVAKCK